MNISAAPSSSGIGPLRRLSVLDQAPIPEGATGGEALRNSIDLARLADGLGYHRYWLAEHHATPMLACASPEALIGPVAAATQRLKVGSGGIMLPHYSPLKVAETFSMLAGMFPGRIDLGLGRAPGSDQRTAYALQRDRRQAQADDFPEQLGELMGYLYDRLPENHPFAPLARTLPGRSECPELWLLGSSPQSGIWAAELGLPYMFADFISPMGASIAQRYRSDFVASEELAAPSMGVAVSVICAETDEEAWRLSASIRMAILLLQAGQADRRADAGEGAGLPAVGIGLGRCQGPQPAPDRGLARHRARRHRGGGAGIRRRGGDDRHHHPRPPGAPALL